MKEKIGKEKHGGKEKASPAEFGLILGVIEIAQLDNDGRSGKGEHCSTQVKNAPYKSLQHNKTEMRIVSY